jgi:hypothetical protein
MAGFIPAIHVLPYITSEDVDAHDKRGHDGWKAVHFKTPFIPAQAGIQTSTSIPWVPAFAGTNGKRLGN